MRLSHIAGMEENEKAGVEENEKRYCNSGKTVL